jgi:hypothetical protein
MQKHVSLELSEEEQGQGAGIGGADGAGFHRPGEVVGEDADGAARRDLLVARIEGEHERRRVHLHGDGGADDSAEERHHAQGELAQHDARLGRGIELGQGEDELRHGDGARAHRRVEESLLGIEVPEDGRGRDFQRRGDVRQRRGGEAARAEGGPRGIEDLIATDAWWSAHDVSKRRFTNWVCQWAFTS